MKAVRNPSNWSSPRPYSPAVVVGEWLYISGHVPVDADGRTCGSDVQGQALQVLENLARTLESAGASRHEVVATTVYLTDVADMDPVDEVYRQFFTGPVLPSRTTVGIAALGRSDFRVEISAIAHIGASGSPL
ncbi:MAG: RidA family protein [Gallionella sp.]|jgi:2-iminobutanoate/2-iminopropanoate deaminase|nr:RidA family protein [Gallionella sp.]